MHTVLNCISASSLIAGDLLAYSTTAMINLFKGSGIWKKRRFVTKRNSLERRMAPALSGKSRHEDITVVVRSDHRCQQSCIPNQVTAKSKLTDWLILGWRLCDQVLSSCQTAIRLRGLRPSTITPNRPTSFSGKNLFQLQIRHEQELMSWLKFVFNRMGNNVLFLTFVSLFRRPQITLVGFPIEFLLSSLRDSCVQKDRRVIVLFFTDVSALTNQM